MKSGKRENTNKHKLDNRMIHLIRLSDWLQTKETAWVWKYFQNKMHMLMCEGPQVYTGTQYSV